MAGFDIILDKVALLGLLTLIGFVAFRTRLLGNEVKTGLQKLIFNLTLPLMIFTVISGFEFSGELLGNGLMVFALTYLFLAMQYLLGSISAKAFRLPDRKWPVHVLHTTFGNVVFLGYPLIHALFPDTPALFYAAVYHLAQMTVIYTWGIYRLDSRSSGGFKANLGKLLNANTIAFFAGFVLMILNIPLPTVVDEAFMGIGSSTLYLSMIYIGMLVAGFRPVSKDFGWDVLVLNINKLLIAPVLVLVICEVLIHYFGLALTPAAEGALVLQTAMPCMAIMVILARNYGADENAAMVNVFSTTLAGLVTVPLIFWALMQVTGI